MSSFLLFYRPLFGGLLPLTAGLLLLLVSELLLSSVLLGIAATYSAVLRPLEAVVFLAGGTAASRGAAVLLAALLCYSRRCCSYRAADASAQGTEVASRSRQAAERSGETRSSASLVAVAGWGRAERWVEGGEEAPPPTFSSPSSIACPSPFSLRFSTSHLNRLSPWRSRGLEAWLLLVRGGRTPQLTPRESRRLAGTHLDTQCNINLKDKPDLF